MMTETTITKTPVEDGVFLFKDDGHEATFDGESLSLTTFITEESAASFLSDVLVHLAEEGEEQVVLPAKAGRSVYRHLGFPGLTGDVCVVWEPVLRGKLYEREVVPPKEQAEWLAQQSAVVFKPTAKKRLTKKEKVTKKLMTMMAPKKKGAQLHLF